MSLTSLRPAITAAAGALVAAVAATQLPRLHPGSNGSMSAEQALARAKPLGVMLAPSAVQVVVEPADLDPRIPGVSPGGRWEVSWQDSQGTPLAVVIYSARTRELLYVSSECSPIVGASAPLNQREAQEHSRYWMTQLGAAAEGRPWRLIGPPDRAGDGSLRVGWDDGDRAAVTLLDPSSGRLRVYLTTNLAGSVHTLLPSVGSEHWEPGARPSGP